jgi:hypothetical protein
MIRKKNVIFHLTNTKQYFAEFHENTKIRMIKAYLKDVSHLENINLMVNGILYNNDELTLRDVAPNNYEIVFRVVINKNEESNSEEIMKENHLLRSENKELQDRVVDLESHQGII